MVIDFYAGCEKMGFPLIFAEMRLKSREDILTGRYGIVSNMCFRLREAGSANAMMPRGSYAVGYVCGSGGDTDDIYRDMAAFIEKKKMKIVGNAYEEYLLDELAEGDPDRFVMRVMIQVG